MKRKEIAEKLEEIADLYEMKGVQFKPRAYRNAAQTIRALGEPVEDIVERGELRDLPGIGESMAEKVEEYLRTGEIGKFNELKGDLPLDIGDLTAVEGLGPKKIIKLHREIGIKSLEDLKDAARSGKIESVEGFGERTQKKILENIAFAEQKGNRFLLGYVLPESGRLVDEMKDLCSRIEVAGSLRRRRETVGDVDIIAVEKKGEDLADRFTSMDEVSKVISKGEKKTSVKLHGGIQVDLRIVEEDYFGAALCYFTGSKQHNITLRTMARKRNLKLSEYGLFEGEERLAGRTEKEVYDQLDLDWIPPEMRENQGEIELAEKGKLPTLVERGDVSGDLQMHSDWSDGKNTMREMAEAARDIGHEYIAMTDHAGEIAIAHGLDLERVKKQGKEIEKLNDDLDGIRIIHGLEANIKKDGKLDISKDVIEEVDLVLGSIHSSLRADRRDMTERMVTAVKSGQFRILAHPTGRRLQERKGIDVDLEDVFEAASEAGTALEINAFPDRLDLNGYNVKRAIDAGVKLSIGTDSHRTDHLRFIDLGVSTARRGWAEKDDVINTLSWSGFSKFLER